MQKSALGLRAGENGHGGAGAQASTCAALFGSEPWLRVGRHALRSRLLVGIEQYTDAALVRAVLDAAESEVFITTYDQSGSRAGLLLADLEAVVGLGRFVHIGTTSFANSADEAISTANKLREAFGIDIIKLDVRDSASMPSAEATTVAAKRLLADGFDVLPLVHPDPGTVRALEDMGCAAIRLMASPVGGYRGITAPGQTRRCVEQMSVPAIVECGIGSPAHVIEAFELGAAAVLVNTLIARAADPAGMAAAVRLAVLAGVFAARSK